MKNLPDFRLLVFSVELRYLLSLNISSPRTSSRSNLDEIDGYVNEVNALKIDSEKKQFSVIYTFECYLLAGAEEMQFDLTVLGCCEDQEREQIFPR